MTHIDWNERAIHFVRSHRRKYQLPMHRAMGDPLAAITYVMQYQADAGLKDDGMAGNDTFAHLLGWQMPLPNLADGRRPLVSRGSEPGHEHSADLCYRAVPGDERSKTRYSNEGAGFSFPAGVSVLAMADGVVQCAEAMSTGHWVWVLHCDLTSTMYFHGSEIHVKLGETVTAGQALMTPGYDISFGPNLIHLHLEHLIDGVRCDPAPILSRAKFVG